VLREDVKKKTIVVGGQGKGSKQTHQCAHDEEAKTSLHTATANFL
jgi:hypothetical protein